MRAYHRRKGGGQSGTIAAVVNALAKAGIELDGDGGVITKAEGEAALERARTKEWLTL